MMSVTRDEPETGQACLFCGKTETVEIFEIWKSHEFVVETCCKAMHETLVRDMADDRQWARAMLRQLGIEDFSGRELRRLADDGCCGMILGWQLAIGPVTLRRARTFIARHHAHCGPPVTWRVGASIWNGRTLLGVVTVGNPVAPGLRGKGVLEVNRLCIRRDVPAALRWNAASMLYGWTAREAAKRGWWKIITYTRADEEGTSLRAAGWREEARVRGRGWTSQKRRRSNRNAWVDKTRSGKELTHDRHPSAQKSRGHAVSTGGAPSWPS
jgi:hypothetical protein